MRISFSGILQFVLGFIVGIALLIGAGAAAAYYFFTRLSAAPPRPTFPIEEPVAELEKPAEVAAEPAEAPKAPEPAAEKKEPEKPKTIQERFGEQAYRARVTWPQGLSLRATPSTQGARVGGIYFNDEVVAIGTSADGRWQKIHIPATGQEAWVKAGNTARLN